MNHQWTPRGNRQKGFVFKQVLQYALFAAFSLWLLYQITQPNSNSGPGRQVSDAHITNFFGRKGSAGILMSTHFTHSGLTLDDITNHREEEGEIPRYSRGIEEVEFRIKPETLKEVNDGNALLRDQDGQTMEKSNISFSDENGIPQHVRDKFIGIETNKTVYTSRVEIQNVIATNGSVEES